MMTHKQHILGHWSWQPHAIDERFNTFTVLADQKEKHSNSWKLSHHVVLPETVSYPKQQEDSYTQDLQASLETKLPVWYKDLLQKTRGVVVETYIEGTPKIKILKWKTCLHHKYCLIIPPWKQTTVGLHHRPLSSTVLKLSLHFSIKTFGRSTPCNITWWTYEWCKSYLRGITLVINPACGTPVFPVTNA